MAQTFNLPTIGDAMTEGEIQEWFVAVGDPVEVDQVICAIETDKSVVELSSPYRGVVLALGGEPGAVLPVGAALLVVGEPGESIDQASDVSDSAADHGARTDDTSSVHSPLVRKLAAEHAVDLTTVAGTGVGGRITRGDVVAAATADPAIVNQATPAAPSMNMTGTNGAAGTTKATGADGTVLAMPKVRRAAREQGIDLARASIVGSGPRGSITLNDLNRSQDKPAAPRREPLSAMRRSIAAHLTESAQTIPQFTSTVEVDMTALLSTRAALAADRGLPIPLDALFIRLLIPVLADHPIINAQLDQSDESGSAEVVYFNHYDIGVAVDTADGLMVPVVRGADQHNLNALGDEVSRLADAARTRTVKPEDFGGQTFTVNNVGALGIVSGTPILPLGTSTIVAFGRARPVVQLLDNRPVEVPTMVISATFDHRLIDGGDSARFLGQLKRHLETPALGLL